MVVVLLKLTGMALICLGALHLFFPKRFRWKEDLAQLSLLNRQIFYVHCVFIVLTLVLMGLLSMFYAEDLLHPTPVNQALLAGLAFFWGFRLFAQWFIYSPDLWRGDRFNTLMHGLFTLLWMFFTITYMVAWLQTVDFLQPVNAAQP